MVYADVNPQSLSFLSNRLWDQYAPQWDNHIQDQGQESDPFARLDGPSSGAWQQDPRPGYLPRQAENRIVGSEAEAQESRDHDDEPFAFAFAFAATRAGGMDDDALDGDGEAPSAPMENPANDAFFMLRFPDCYCLVNSHNLMICRDETYANLWKAEKKAQRRNDKAHRRAREAEAEQALDAYSREPDSLQGRPQPGLLSYYSASGGPVGFPPASDDEDELAWAKSQRRKHRQNANSSSANSVAPQDLHSFGIGAGEQMITANPMLGEDGTALPLDEWASLPVHPTVPGDIKKISREHLQFSWDGETEQWVLIVRGKTGVMVNEVYHARGSAPVPLHDGDEIMFSSVHIQFILANDGHDMEEVTESIETLDEDHEAALEAGDEDDADDDNNQDDEDEQQLEQDEPRRRGVKLKLVNKQKAKRSADPDKPTKSDDKKAAASADNNAKGGRGRGKGAEKPAKKVASQDEQGIDPALISSLESVKKPDKGKKPQRSASNAMEGGETPTLEEPIAGAAEATAAAAQTSPPAASLTFEPGSVLAELAPEQMPEKRKGPGRPPKNGLLSKRDEAAVKRKQKEYEKNGEPVPELTQLVSIVRQEQKVKDALAKRKAAGEANPDIPIPSTEIDPNLDPAGLAQSAPRESQGLESSNPNGGREQSSPKPTRAARQVSPVKPREQCTEEELKKPNITYLHILDEVLRNVEGGHADLQTIYDKIRKRWPYFEYTAESVGWQSSVRHNLLQNVRFKEAGKSGKGKLWTIDYDQPLDTKKKRPTPPPRTNPVLMPPNGQMSHGLPGPPNQYGQPAYPPQYGQPPAHGAQPIQGHYYNSPYAIGSAANYGPPPQGQYGPPGHPSNSPMPPSNMHHLHGAGYRQQSQQPPAPQASPAAPAKRPPFQPVVDEIMAFHKAYLEPYLNTPEYERQQKMFSECTARFSDAFHKGIVGYGVSEMEASVEPTKTMKTIFDRNWHLVPLIKAEAAANAKADAASAAAGQTSQTPAGPPSSIAPPLGMRPQSAVPPPYMPSTSMAPATITQTTSMMAPTIGSPPILPPNTSMVSSTLAQTTTAPALASMPPMTTMPPTTTMSLAMTMPLATTMPPMTTMPPLNGWPHSYTSAQFGAGLTATAYDYPNVPLPPYPASGGTKRAAAAADDDDSGGGGGGGGNDNDTNDNDMKRQRLS